MFSAIGRSIADSIGDGEEAFLLGNVSVRSQLDAVLIRANSIVVLEMKNYSGDITGSENGEWLCSTPRGNLRINQGRENPFEQVKKYRGHVVDKIKKSGYRLGDQRARDASDKWIHFVSGLIVFKKVTSFTSDIDFDRIKWFRITDIDGLSGKIREIGSMAIELTGNEIITVSKILSDDMGPKPVTVDPPLARSGFDEAVSFLKKEGFIGFRPINDLLKTCDEIALDRGVYMVLYKGTEPPTFVLPGSGGHFKGRDPNVSLLELQKKWVPGSNIIYIGQTESSLRRRITQYMRFGQGNDVGHYGGRYIWQIEGPKDLVVCWKPMANGTEVKGGCPVNPKDAERWYMARFKERHGRLPYANLRES